jgi:hypothetical protein
MRVHVLVAALLVSFAAVLNANDPLSMAVSPALSIAPANLTIRVRIEPDEVNRMLEVEAESGGYYRSSHIPLEGAQAPRTLALEFRRVPGGDYDVRGTLISSDGKKRAAVRQHVIVSDPASTGATP